MHMDIWYVRGSRCGFRLTHTGRLVKQLIAVMQSLEQSLEHEAELTRLQVDMRKFITELAQALERIKSMSTP